MILFSCLLAAMAAGDPLPLPDNFNPETHMIVNQTDLGTFLDQERCARGPGLGRQSL
jgi:hypothetical protein